MANIELDGVNKKIKVDSGDLTLDVPGDIVLDADGGDVVVADGGTNILKVTNSSSDVVLQPQVDAKDIIFKQYDGTTVATVEDNGTFNIPANKLAIGGTAVTSTAAELNLLDGGTSVGSSITLADGDGFVVNDGGTMKTIPASDISTYAGGNFVKLGTVATNNSNVSALTIDNCFSSTYDMYRIVGYHSATSGGAHNYFRWRTGGSSGSSYTTSDYQWINEGAHIKSEPLYENYYNWNYSANHGRVASAMDVDADASYVTFNLLVSDPNTNVMSRAQVTGTSCVRMTADDKWTTHQVAITNAANVNATGFEMTISTGYINYGRVTVYGLVQ